MGQNVTIICSNCKKQSVAPVELVGKQARCPSCKAVFVVQMTGQPVTQPPRPATQQVSRPPTQAVPRPGQPPAPAARQPTGATSARLPAQRPPASAQGQAPRPQTQSLPAQRPTAQRPAVPAQQPPQAAPAPTSTHGAPAAKSRLSQIRERPGARHRLPPKRKSNKVVYFVITILLLAGLGTGLAWVLGAFENPKEDVKNRFKAFVATINREELAEVKKFFFSEEKEPPYLAQLLKLEFDLNVISIDVDDREARVTFEGSVFIKGEKEKTEIKLPYPPAISVWKQGGNKIWYISPDRSHYPFNEYFSKYISMKEDQP